MLPNNNNIIDNNSKVNNLSANISNIFQLNQEDSIRYFNEFVEQEKEEDGFIERQAVKIKEKNRKLEAEANQERNLKNKNNVAKLQQEKKKVLKEVKARVLKQNSQLKPFMKFFSCVPQMHISYVLNIIKKQFKGDTQKYIDSVQLFNKHFTEDHKLICDSIVACDVKIDRRKLNKQKKELMLYSAQLLGLVGKARAKILNESLVKHYLDEMAKAEEFSQKFRLIHKSGKIMRFVSLARRQKQRQAQILKISKCMSLMSKEKEYTYTLLTLTNPPIYHPRPSLGENSFEAITPSESHAKLMDFWKSIRANLAEKDIHAGEQRIFGLEVLEFHKDSCPHVHVLIYHSKEDKDMIHHVINGVQNRHNEQFPINENMTFGEKRQALKRRVKFDIRSNDGRASGSTYVFKYITKCTASYNSKDTSAVKNSACRYYYSARSFNFFGLRGSITKFNFLQANYHLYQEYMPLQVIDMFNDNDYYSFVTHYADVFKNVHYRDENGDRKLLGVSFDFAKSLEVLRRLGIAYDLTDVKASEKNIILIEKKQYCIFEKTDDFDDEKHIDANDSLSMEVKKAYKAVCKKQDYYDVKKCDYISDQLLYKKDVITIEIDGMQVLNKIYNKKGMIAQLSKAVQRTSEDPLRAIKASDNFVVKIKCLKKSNAVQDCEDLKILQSINYDFFDVEKDDIIDDGREDEKLKFNTVFSLGYTFEKPKKNIDELQLFNIIQERASLAQFEEVLELLN